MAGIQIARGDGRAPDQRTVRRLARLDALFTVAQQCLGLADP